MKGKFSSQTDIRKLVVLYFISFGVYPLYWLLANWGYIKQHHQKDLKVGWKRFGLFVPFYNLYVMWQQFDAIFDMMGKKVKTGKWDASKMYVLFLGIAIIANGISMYLIPAEGYILLDLLAASCLLIPIIMTQNYMNKYFKSVEKKLPSRLRFGEIIVVIIGLLFWSVTLFL